MGTLDTDRGCEPQPIKRFAYPALFVASLHLDELAFVYLSFRIKCGQFFWLEPTANIGATDHVPKMTPGSCLLPQNCVGNFEANFLGQSSVWL